MSKRKLDQIIRDRVAPPVRILSWDVGSVNLAYCLMTRKGSQYEIHEWGLFDLTVEFKLCSKENCHYQCMDDDHCMWHGGTKTLPQFRKDTEAFRRQLYTILETRPEFCHVNVVCIENQPSRMNPIAKTIATAIYDYFLIRGHFDRILTGDKPIRELCWISPTQKIKEIPIACQGAYDTLIEKKYTPYVQTKKLAVILAQYWIPDVWKTRFNKIIKMDDLADAFLIGRHG